MSWRLPFAHRRHAVVTTTGGNYKVVAISVNHFLIL
ncbi:hypothetical protein HD_1313 [[Haemophilus] ducreyi 35000HP]|uniref:Uncharacterized protein n=1 Tax=Haemophilus ducreyi (strain 35000HP / ATCC 700724) TaxID=233412 RepID=Q7VLV0_HAEDU|nr:hypothetical protein HD_1313 [[Haemophilus] ducreyi 35000HP]